MTIEKVCIKCKRVVTGKQCPVCKTSNLSTKWKGLLVVLDPAKSELAAKTGLGEGKYALVVK